MAVLLVIRHGETTWNAIRKLQGQLETDLSEAGKKQASVVAKHLAKQASELAAIYSSDLKRATDTARVIAERIGCSEVKLRPKLRERHLGRLQGLTASEALQLEKEAYKALTSTSVPIPDGGESFEQVCERVKQAAEEIAAEHQGEKVVIVTHGGVVQAMHIHATGRTGSAAANASISTFTISGNNQWSLQAWSDVHHLKEVGILTSNFGGDLKSG